jgi:hypothetical protein
MGMAPLGDQSSRGLQVWLAFLSIQRALHTSAGMYGAAQIPTFSISTHWLAHCILPRWCAIRHADRVPNGHIAVAVGLQVDRSDQPTMDVMEASTGGGCL